MGEAKRRRELEEHRKTIPRPPKIRWIKGIFTFLAAPILIPLLLSYICFKQNNWPWKIQ